MHSYRSTKTASYIAFVVQAIVNNVPPLLYLIISRRFGISLVQIASLMSFNFLSQILVDVIGARSVDRIGYRPCIVCANLCSVAGLISFGLLPYVISNTYVALLVATFLYAIGSGLIEVVASPVMESLPTDSKSGSMALLHSFYCWGQLAVVLGTTLFLNLFGRDLWFVLPLIWAIVPTVDAIMFCKVPLLHLSDSHEPAPLRILLRTPVYMLMLVMMICSGACEMAMSQWASLFAELGLSVSKNVGDLLGPSLFALFMACGRVFYAKNSERLPIHKALFICGCISLCAYIATVFSPWPIVSLLGCAFCGLGASIMWPASLSLAAQCCPMGNTSSFAILSMGGDIGCTLGPGIVGLISDSFRGDFLVYSGESAGLHVGLLGAVAFPLVMAIAAYSVRRFLPRK